MPDKDRYSRADLGVLKALPRQDVFEALRSFDDRGMERDAFVLRTAALLDAERVPGLEQARQDGDPGKVLAVVLRACAQQKTTVADGKAIDDDVLALAVRLRTGLPVRMAVLLYPYRGAVPPEVTFAFDGERVQVHGAETGPIAVQCRLP